jgi:hypothetical protein
MDCEGVDAVDQVGARVHVQRACMRHVAVAVQDTLSSSGQHSPIRQP